MSMGRQEGGGEALPEHGATRGAEWGVGGQRTWFEHSAARLVGEGERGWVRMGAAPSAACEAERRGAEHRPGTLRPSDGRALYADEVQVRVARPGCCYS
jgi:hypothetical protein